MHHTNFPFFPLEYSHNNFFLRVFPFIFGFLEDECLCEGILMVPLVRLIIWQLGCNFLGIVPFLLQMNNSTDSMFVFTTSVSNANLNRRLSWIKDAVYFCGCYNIASKSYFPVILFSPYYYYMFSGVIFWKVAFFFFCSCGLWVLLHSLSVRIEDGESHFAFTAICEFVHNFFVCEECRQHFYDMCSRFVFVKMYIFQIF